MPVTRVRDALADDAGITLIELVVAMGLSVIVATMGLFLVVDSGRTSQVATDRSIGSAQARTTLQSWTAYLHVADGPAPGSADRRFEWLTANDVLFHAGIGNRSGGVGATATPRIVWLRLTSDGHLVEEQFSGDATYPKTPLACRVLADHVTASPLFAASNPAGAPVSGATGIAPTAGSTCASLDSSVTQTDPNVVANLQTVAAVAISFTVTDARGQHSQTYTAIAQVPTLAGAS